MKDEKFNKYLSEHNLVAVSKEFYLVLLNDHLKIQRLKELTAKYDNSKTNKA